MLGAALQSNTNKTPLSFLSLQQDPQPAAEAPQSLCPPASTELITAALTGFQKQNTENRNQPSWRNARCFSETLNYVIRSVSGQSEQSVLIKTPHVPAAHYGRLCTAEVWRLL